MVYAHRVRFAKGALQRHLDSRAISQKDFAKIAGVSATSVLKGCRGDDLSKRVGSAILIGLTVVPVIATDDLEVAL